MVIDKDALLAAINALPDASPADSVALQQQVSDLQGKLDAANQALSAEQVSDQSKEATLQAKIDAAKAALA